MESLDNRDSVPKYWNVYVHINRINGKTYVGITSKDLIRRFGCQGQGYKGQAFWGAIQKYGWENFDHITVKDNISKEGTNWYYIKYNNKYGFVSSLYVKK